MLKKLLFTYLCVVLMPCLGSAESMFITDTLEIVVRRGKGPEYKILAVARSNEKVEVLAVEGEYAKLRLKNGIEGWILGRYLTQDRPKPFVIKNLKKNIAEYKEKNKGLKKKLSVLEKDKSVLEATSASQQKNAASLVEELDELKRSCADFIQLRDNHEKIQQELAINKRTISRLVQENDELRKNRNLKWFIAGASAILIGFIIGIVLQRSRQSRKRKISF